MLKIFKLIGLPDLFFMCGDLLVFGVFYESFRIQKFCIAQMRYFWGFDLNSNNKGILKESCFVFGVFYESFRIQEFYITQMRYFWGFDLKFKQ